ncbi:DEAD/DEAH box helicase family protein [bacterium]|nr:DEAD/DEAH box helicase family protein [bacterium]
MAPETPTSLKTGDKVLHPYNRDLGPGVVQEITGPRMTVHFPKTADTLVFAVANHPFVPLDLRPGADPERWMDDFQDDVVGRLARRDADGVDAFRHRLAALELTKLREADGLGSFLGGRIELFPHQLHVAEAATRTRPVRWLLADEVGLGKTVEACLILNHLVQTGRADSVLVVAPRSLVVQWLGELYRKFHQVFVLVDKERREDVRRENGPGFNPFDVHHRAVVALEDLEEDSSLARLAHAARPDLLVVDEAHRLRRRRGTEGSPAYRAVAPMCAESENVLLLSATPLEADAHGFFRLLEMLHPDRYSSWDKFQKDLEEGVPLHPCTSSTSRADIGGLPPRRPVPVDLAPSAEREAKELAVLSMPATNAHERNVRAEKFARVLAEPLGAEDPRIAWLGKRCRKWDQAGDKTLIFVHEREALVFLKKELEYHTSRRIAVFHEDLSPAQRDLEVARFAEADGPNVLIATESGGEGRNFQFARRLVLFDLPWDPVVVEQRIGRLDRINRQGPVEIVYFRPAEGFGAEIARMYEALGIFLEPLGGLDRALGHVVDKIREALDGSGGNLDVKAIVEETHEARERIAKAVYHHLHRARYRPEMAEAILARVPAELEKRTASVVLEACRQFGFEMEPKGGAARWYLEFGSEATIDSLHGVGHGARYLGTFDRAEAVEKEGLDFFASGHPLVEAVLGELADGTRGRVALQEIRAGFNGIGILVVEKIGPEFTLSAWDLAAGRERPEWVDLVTNPPGSVREIPGTEWNVPEWDEHVQDLFGKWRTDGEIVALSGVLFRA